MEYYDVAIPKPILPSIVLDVENRYLGISAGLMDRVAQVYGGLVFMNFDQALIERDGHGRYESLDLSALPPLFVAYRTDLAEGSEVFHNNIRERWIKGDPEVTQAMSDFADYAQEVRDLLVAGRGDRIGGWMDRNFDRRRSLYTLSDGDIRMVEQARSVGASGKFAGSGGAIVGTYPDEATYDKLVEVYADTGTEVFKPTL
jgi:glucuronokinase